MSETVVGPDQAFRRDDAPNIEEIPLDSVVASFSHAGEDFRVLRQVHNIESSSYSYLVLDKEQVAQGEITGKHAKIGKASNFIPRSTENFSKTTKRPIPHLMSTAIGEIVLQSEEGLIWHSSPILSRQGRRMYEGLSKEVETEGSRFYDKLQVNKWVSRYDGFDHARYTIQKLGRDDETQ